MRVERNLISAGTSGLCNRLLLLAGCLRIAELTRRSITVYWPMNEALGCGFNELFTNQFEMVTDSDLANILKTNFNVKVYNAWKTDGPTYRTVRPDGDPDAHIVIIKGWSDPRFENEPFSAEIDADIRRRLLAIKPLPEIAAYVDSFDLPPATIGVHVRRGDSVEEFSKSRDEDFFGIMRAILEERSDVTFFLATDVPEIERRFRGEFGTVLRSAPKAWAPRWESRGAREGLIDLLLLARTGGIIGTIHSSFSQTAARLGNIPMRWADDTSAGERLRETSAVMTRYLSRDSSSEGA